MSRLRIVSFEVCLTQYRSEVLIQYRIIDGDLILLKKENVWKD